TAHICPSGIKGLDVLPAGPRSANPAELLAGPQFSQLLSWAGAVYDLILIDTTPALITADPAIISRVVDGVTMVIQPAKNRRHRVMRMVERFTLLKLPVLGVVINSSASEDHESYYGYGYGYKGYYGDDYGYGYGEEEETTPETPQQNDFDVKKDSEKSISLGEPTEGNAIHWNIPRRVA
ncbi:MAG: hypothetical protein ACWGMZ_11135, partial [Thermoguttaceae bacterium]